MRHGLVIPLFTALLFSLGAPALAPRADEDDLTREWASFRRAQIASVSYDVHLTLREDAEDFEGRATLQVTLNQDDAPLSIDLKAKAIRGVTVNGAPVQGLIKRNGSFDIPPESLARGPMTITVEYTGHYSVTREGLCHYTDPLDQREYFYTNLEPYGAHLFLPCFDQPDIKGTYALTLTTPASWSAIGNTPVLEESTRGPQKTTRFKPTPPLSTYLYFAGGGEYRVWRDTYNGLPLALYARESLAEFFEPEQLFSETKSGLAYFNAYFGTPYPFEKYDHVFAPELGAGAMENPGAVTMNEYMIFRGTPTKENYRGRNNTLLHEMAHMWFGDLVTMAWWNDLWLNESFATFSAYQAQAALEEYEGIWERFYQTKGWAYAQDQLSSTHPVEVEVPSARLAIANFDGITYAKGASALKQLWFTVGAEAYQRGVVEYFRKYAWQNATREQFMAAVAGQTDLALDTWTRKWLQTEGLNSVALDFQCADGAVAAPVIRQSRVNAPVLSPHQTQVALFAFNAYGKLTPYETLSVRYSGDADVVAGMAGLPCPDFVYPNYGDMDYGLFFLDERSYQTVLKHLGALEDPFVRRMVWGTLYSMVRHQKLGASVLMDLILKNLPRESEPGMLEFLLGNRPTREVFRSFLPLEARLQVAPGFSQLLWDGYQSAAPGTDARLHWLDAYVSTASLSEETARLRGLLESGTAGGDLDQPRRWQVIRRLASLGAEGIDPLVEAELARDGSDQGTRYAFSIRGAVPTLKAKRAQWERLKDPELSYSLLRTGASTFHDSLHPALIDVFVDDWFDYIASRDWTEEQHRISLWFGELMPPVYTTEFLERSRASLEKAHLPERARRAWQESNDAIARIIAIQSYNDNDA